MFSRKETTQFPWKETKYEYLERFGHPSSMELRKCVTNLVHSIFQKGDKLCESLELLTAGNRLALGRVGFGG